MDPDNKTSKKIKVQAFLLEYGTTNDWVRWCIQLDKLICNTRLNAGMENGYHEVFVEGPGKGKVPNHLQYS